jgi:hypothetical protein
MDERKFRLPLSHSPFLLDFIFWNTINYHLAYRKKIGIINVDVDPSCGVMESTVHCIANVSEILTAPSSRRNAHPVTLGVTEIICDDDNISNSSINKSVIITVIIVKFEAVNLLCQIK